MNQIELEEIIDEIFNKYKREYFIQVRLIIYGEIINKIPSSVPPKMKLKLLNRLYFMIMNKFKNNNNYRKLKTISIFDKRINNQLDQDILNT